MTKTEVEHLIAERHWRGGESIRSIERSIGIGKTTLSGSVKRFGIKIRTRKEQIAITNRAAEVVAKRSGDRHWAWGKRKESDAWARAASERMSGSRNPAHHSMEKMARGRALTWRAVPTKCERFLATLFTKSGDSFVFQHAVGRFVLDFAWPAYRVGLEIDSTKRGARRKAKALIRDRFLVEQGWKIIRASNEHAVRPWHLFTVLKQFVRQLKAVSAKPPGTRQYRVLVRDAQYPAGRKV